MIPDVVAVGHIARDEFAGEDGWRLGGSALYAAATTARLGARTLLITRVAERERPALAERCHELGIELRALPASVTTTFAHRFDEHGHRTLRLKARALSIGAADVPSEARGAPALVLGSIAHELGEDLLASLPRHAAVLIGQGYLREWTADGTIKPREWDDALDILEHVRVVVVSEDDLTDLSVAKRWAAVTPVVVTLAERGARLYEPLGEVTIDGFPVREVVDQTGAGDAFAAALALALADGLALREAIRDANAVASFAVEGKGTSGLADRARVEERTRAG
ncbi:MAG: hypothetical protein HY071_03385 [Chloroflexi bacterium]|nr:hypothetical protein [Chloroflexota bacterium]